MGKFQKKFITVESHALINLTDVYNINRIDTSDHTYRFKIRFYFNNKEYADWKFSDSKKRNTVYEYICIKLGIVFRLSDITITTRTIETIDDL